MPDFSDALGRVLRAAIKLLLVLAASVFVLSFLVAALFAVVVMSIWSPITGRKPAPVVLFGRMREQSRRYAQGVWPGPGAPRGEVVDVDATVVDEPPPTGSTQRLR